MQTQAVVADKQRGGERWFLWRRHGPIRVDINLFVQGGSRDQGGQLMTTRVLVLLGTKKGAFILESGAARETWSLRGPFCETWPMNHVIADPTTGTIYGAGGNEWF